MCLVWRVSGMDFESTIPHNWRQSSCVIVRFGPDRAAELGSCFAAMTPTSDGLQPTSALKKITWEFVLAWGLYSFGDPHST